MKRAAIYCRVSTSGQAEQGTSLTTQLESCRRLALSLDYSIVREVQEDVSGAKLQRAGLDELRDMARDGLIDALLVSDTDRLTRDLGHLMLLVDELERAHVELRFANTPHDSTPEGMMLLQMRGIFAQYERVKIRERTRRGKEKRIKEGAIYISGSGVYGYTYVRGEGRLEVLEQEAHWVRRMFEWASEGVSIRQIAKRLHEAGVRTKKGASHWYPEVIANILRNELYAGTWHYGKRASVVPTTPSRTGKRTVPAERRERRAREEWLSALSPAIVDRTLYEAVQPQLQRNKVLSPRNSKYPYLLRGFIVCGRCGYRMYGHNKISPTSSRLAYECTGRNIVYPRGLMPVRCTQQSVTASDLEDLVWGEVVRQLCHPTLLTEEVQRRAQKQRNAQKKDEAELGSLGTQEASIQKEVNEVLDLYHSGIIDRTILQQRMALLRARQGALRDTKARVSSRMSTDTHPTALGGLQTLTDEEKEALRWLDYESKRKFLLRWNVSVALDGAKVSITGLIQDVVLTLKTRYKAAS